MKRCAYLLLLAAMVLPSGCAERKTDQAGSAASDAKSQSATEDFSLWGAAGKSVSPSKTDSAPPPPVAVSTPQVEASAPAADPNLKVSLEQASAVQSSVAAAERKIIRNAELAIETDSPAGGQQRITAIAESLGGFVVTSDFKQTAAQGRPSQSVVVVVRVPAVQFNAALEQIHGIGGTVVQKKITGQDVSEEYLDVEARIRTKKALEAQFLEIMKQAKKVSDALEVQNELAGVRTEIERLEGRRRFLDNQSALSTITVNLQLPAPVVATTGTGFGHDVKQAFGDAVDTAAALVLFLIRALIILMPFALIFGPPAWFIWRLARRRIRLNDKPTPVVES